MFIISTTVWVNGWDTCSVASRARSELTSLQCNWKGNRKGKGTDETPQGLSGISLNALNGLFIDIKIRKIYQYNCNH